MGVAVSQESFKLTETGSGWPVGHGGTDPSHKKRVRLNKANSLQLLTLAAKFREEGKRHEKHIETGPNFKESQPASVTTGFLGVVFTVLEEGEGGRQRD